jgi:hypothetical protein
MVVRPSEARSRACEVGEDGGARGKDKVVSGQSRREEEERGGERRRGEEAQERRRREEGRRDRHTFCTTASEAESSAEVALLTDRSDPSRG